MLAQRRRLFAFLAMLALLASCDFKKKAEANREKARARALRMSDELGRQIKVQRHLAEERAKKLDKVIQR